MAESKDTCNQDCKFWKKYKDKCPFYMETLWSPFEADGQVVYRKDCSPKRSLILHMEMYNMIVGLHKASNQEREIQHQVLHKLFEISPFPKQITVSPEVEMIPEDMDE